MKLSIAMMVKNESKYIGRCLEALQPLRDAVDSELIIVDTGSEDNTVEIAEKFTDKVFFHEWNNDFAQMRNITIGYTKGEWIFVLDADEIIENPAEIISFFTSGLCDKYNSAIVFIKNIMNEKDKADYSLLPLVRLFKRYEGFRYEGIVHEQPKFREPVFILQTQLIHYGYIHTDREQMERKFKRNVPLLEKQLEEEPENHYTWYQLSKSYAAYENHAKALEMCLKAYDIAKKKKVLGKSIYIYIQLALCYYWNHKFEELEDLCLEALKQKVNHIDFYFLLGKAQMVLGKDTDAIRNYEIYLDMLKNFRNYYNSGDITASAYTTGHADAVRTDLAVLYYKKKEYKRVLEYAGMIKDERYLEKLYPQLIKAYIKLELYEDLFIYYRNKVLIQDESRINSFLNALESIKLSIEKEESDKIEELFAEGEGTYSDLNRLRISLSKKASTVDKNVIGRLESLDFSQLQPYYGDVVYYLMKNKRQLMFILSNVNENKIQSYVSYIVEKYEDSSDVLMDYLDLYKDSDMEPCAQRIRRVLLKALLSVDKLDNTSYREAFNDYISNGIEYVKRVYNQSLIDSELISEVKSNEDAFLMYMLLSEKYKHFDQRKYVSLIRKGLKAYPEMSKGIELLIQDIQEIAGDKVVQDDIMNAGNKNTDGEILGHSADSAAHDNKDNQNARTEFDEYKTLIKKKIEGLIESGELDAAEDLIREYENLVSGDADIYSMKAVIAMARQELEIAEGILTEGMNVCGHKFDLLYNMAYLYEITGRSCEAIRYYGFARDNCFDEETVGEITDRINELSASLEKATEKLPGKRVLIIAHIFPPVGGSGVQRTLKFVKYLRNNGWEPVVVTVGETQYPLKDKSLVDEIPEGVKVVRIDEDFSVNQDILKEIIGLYSGMVNNNLLIEEYIKEVNSSKQDDLQTLLTIPDPFVFWANLVLKAIKSKIDFNDIDLIYSTSGPYSDHIIGYYLKKDYGKPWVADFRDEWTNNCYAVYDKKAIRYRLEFAMENSIVQYADKIITTTPLANENYRSIFSLEDDKVITITNGYDEEDFKDLTEPTAKNEKFTIMHNGLLYLARTPITFYNALGNLIKSGHVKRDKVKVYFTWTENDKLWKEHAQKFGLEDVIEFTGYLSHRESLEKAVQADMLLLIVGPGEEKNSVYPGKIFEYLRLNKPIISLSPVGGIVEQLLHKTQSGYNADFDDVEKIESYLLKLYNSWENGELSHRPDNKSIEKFSRENLTSKISVVFNSLLRTKDNVSSGIIDTEHNM